MRLIDADALKKTIKNMPNDYYGDLCVGDALKEIDNAPTISAVPVVRGEWIQKHHIISLNNMTLTGTYPTCNLCDYAEVGMAKNTNYCPNCGADMREDKP